jgi:hypothetical protein
VNLPAAITLDRAQLPRRYTEACAALFRCDQVDECAEWSNKAAAIASYAKQARDETLKVFAARIQARAVRRMGELLQAVPAVKGRPAADVAVSRSAAARTAGISKIQKDTALATAAIPAADFEKLVEASEPPPPYKLRLIGRGSGKVGRPRGDAVSQLRRELAKAEVSAQVCAINLTAALTLVNELRARIASYQARDPA